MRTNLWVLFAASGCGLFEGVQEDVVLTCDRLSEVEVSDPEVGTAFLAPLGARLDELTATYPVEATEPREGGGPYPGTVTVTASGPILAVESRVPPGEALSPFADPYFCDSRYEVPVQAVLELDGGLLRVDVSLTALVYDTTPQIRAAGDGFWDDAATAMTGTLDLSLGDKVPDQVSLVVFLEDGAASGGLSLASNHSSYWGALDF